MWLTGPTHAKWHCIELARGTKTRNICMYTFDMCQELWHPDVCMLLRTSQELHVSVTCMHMSCVMCQYMTCVCTRARDMYTKCMWDMAPSMCTLGMKWQMAWIPRAYILCICVPHGFGTHIHRTQRYKNPEHLHVYIWHLHVILWHNTERCRVWMTEWMFHAGCIHVTYRTYPLCVCHMP